MARRTKEEALATRHRLIDAAELLFQAHGVSRTSLQQIAEKAGATRGAVYWHFKNKADLFNAMMERVTLPLETAAHEAGKADLDPLGQIEQVMVEALRLMTKDPQVRRVFEVATHKVEYTDEMQSVQQRHLDVRNVCIQDFERAMRLAARRERIQPTIPTASAALGMHALVSGLIQEWLLDPDAFDLVAAGRQTFGAYLMGLGFPRPAAVPADGGATRQEVAKVPLPGAPR